MTGHRKVLKISLQERKVEMEKLFIVSREPITAEILLPFAERLFSALVALYPSKPTISKVNLADRASPASVGCKKTRQGFREIFSRISIREDNRAGVFAQVLPPLCKQTRTIFTWQN
jgi:hypothetical protein